MTPLKTSHTACILGTVVLVVSIAGSRLSSSKASPEQWKEVSGSVDPVNAAPIAATEKTSTRGSQAPGGEDEKTAEKDRVNDLSLLMENARVKYAARAQTAVSQNDTDVNPFGLTAAAREFDKDLPVAAESLDTPDKDQADLDKLTRDVLEVALADSEQESTNQAVIEFTFTPTPGIHFLPVPAILAPATVVYSRILSSTGCTPCIVKWKHMESEEIEFLSIENLQAGQLRTLFVTPSDQWQIGSYDLSVYDASDSPVLIGQSTLPVAGIDINQPTVIPPVEFLQSLVENGLVSTREQPIYPEKTNR